MTMTTSLFDDIAYRRVATVADLRAFIDGLEENIRRGRVENTFRVLCFHRRSFDVILSGRGEKESRSSASDNKNSTDHVPLSLVEHELLHVWLLLKSVLDEVETDRDVEADDSSSSDDQVRRTGGRGARGPGRAGEVSTVVASQDSASPPPAPPLQEEREDEREEDSPLVREAGDNYPSDSRTKRRKQEGHGDPASRCKHEDTQHGDGGATKVPPQHGAASGVARPQHGDGKILFVDSQNSTPPATDLVVTIPLLPVVNENLTSNVMSVEHFAKKPTTPVFLRNVRPTDAPARPTTRSIRASHLVLPWFSAHQLFLLQRMESYLIPQKGALDMDLRRLSVLINEKLVAQDQRCPVCHEGFGGWGTSCSEQLPPDPQNFGDPSNPRSSADIVGSSAPPSHSPETRPFLAALVPRCGHGIHVSCFVRLCANFSSSNRGGQCRLCCEPCVFSSPGKKVHNVASSGNVVVWNLANAVVCHLAGPLVHSGVVEQRERASAERERGEGTLAEREGLLVQREGPLAERGALAEREGPVLAERERGEGPPLAEREGPLAVEGGGGPVDPELVEALSWRLASELGLPINTSNRSTRLEKLFWKFINREIDG